MILVTGATGFLGSELARQLALQGENLVCIKRDTSVIPEILTPYAGQIKWVEADMLNIFALEAALQGVTGVYHCAAWVTFETRYKKQQIKTNVEGTANLVNLCNDHAIRLLHVSSIVAVGEAKPGELTTENHHLEETPHNDGYAISKYESEMEVWRGIAEGLNAVIVNPSLIIGASSGTKGTGQIFETVRKGLKYYSAGTCGLVDVADVARSMIMLMNSPIQAERFIISAENWSYRDLFIEAAKNLGVDAPKNEAKPWMLNMAWRFSSIWTFVVGKPKGLDRVSAEAASKTLNFSNAKLTAAIPIRFKPVKQTIQEVCKALANDNSM